MAAKTWVAVGAVVVIAGLGAVWANGRSDGPEAAAPDVASAPAPVTPVATPAPADRPRARAEPTAAAPAPPAAAPPVEAPLSVKDRLARTTSLTLEQIPFELALATIAEDSGVDIYLAKGLLGDRSADEQTIASLQLENTTFGQAVSVTSMVSGFRATTLEDRVVVHAMGATAPPASEQVRVRRRSEFPQATVTFRVVSPDGSPVAGAAILLQSGRALATADAAGTADVRMPPPFPDVLARAPGFADSRRIRPKADPAKPSECLLEMRGPAATLVGVVRGEEGRPVADVNVTIVPVASGREQWADQHIVRADAQGAWTDPSCAPGTVVVFVAAQDRGPARVDVTASANTETRVEVTLPREAVCEGVLRLADGTPVAGSVSPKAAGFWHLRGVDTGADGRFRLGGLPAGKVTLTARAPGNATATVEIELAAGETRTWDATLLPKR